MAGWLAMITPALLIIPSIRHLGHRAEHPRAKMVLRAVVLASAGLLWSATVPMAAEAVRDPVTIGIAVVGLGFLLTTRIDSLWVILAAAAVQLAAASAYLVAGL